jgi:two-component system alkaline phosphatase synthesis response regulator PhoP
MRESILVVEDDEDVAKITASFLRAKKYDVVVAHDGPTALELVTQRLPRVILLDIMMPRMSGLEVLRILRENPETATIPVILVTAKVRNDDVIEGYQHGADYYITKPFTPDQLEYGIKMVLGQTDDATTSGS